MINFLMIPPHVKDFGDNLNTYYFLILCQLSVNYIVGGNLGLRCSSLMKNIFIFFSLPLGCDVSFIPLLTIELLVYATNVMSNENI